MYDVSPRLLRFSGIALVLMVLAAFGLTAAFYNRAFSNDATVTVDASRTGLIMAAGNKVKVRGVEIGRVVRVEPRRQNVGFERRRWQR